MRKIIYIPGDYPAFKSNGDKADCYAVEVGEVGYWPIYTKASVESLNKVPMTAEIIDAAVTASMFGNWDQRYGAGGELMKPLNDWIAKRWPATQEATS